MKFSPDIEELLKEKYPDVNIYNMTLDELKAFRIEIEDLRHEYSLIELANKTLGNAAYGSSANRFFYFYNVNLAADITGECRNLTKTMWHNLEEFFHETLWERKDIQEQFGFELDESKHDWYRQQPVSIYSDTDSVYTTYGTLFKAMTPESQKKYETDEQKLEFILKFNKEFVDKQNNKWCEEMYNPRHGQNVHEFELETVSKAGIYLKKKKYLKGLIFSKGKYYDHPKTSGTGIELIKSTSPGFCRDNLPKILNELMFSFTNKSKEEFILEFNMKMMQLRKEFYKADVEYISQSVGIGDYDKYVTDDEEFLILEKACPVSVQAIARYNHLAHKHGRDDMKIFAGKIKYYNIDLGNGRVGFFGFPAGELPEWAPPVHKIVQWEKNVIGPINRFLEVMDIPLLNSSEAQQQSLF